MGEPEIKIGGKFILGRKLGAGSFGEIFLAINVMSGEQEPVKSRHPQLIYEARLLKLLQGKPGIPNVFWYGIDGDYNIMVMDLLGPSLEDLFNYCNRAFTIKTTIMILDQLISRIEYLHSRDFIHRDIKPDNFLIGLGNKSTLVHVIDFGLSKRYRDPKTGEHIFYRTNKNLTGTARYASVNSHLGIEQSRRDDLESIIYLGIYFTKGSLPWQGLPAKTKQEKYQKIMEVKCKVPSGELCAQLPIQIKNMLDYAKNLRFDEQPDYNHFRIQLKELFISSHYKYDYIFDWLKKDYIATANQYLQKKDVTLIYKQIHDADKVEESSKNEITLEVVHQPNKDIPPNLNSNSISKKDKELLATEEKKDSGGKDARELQIPIKKSKNNQDVANLSMAIGANNMSHINIQNTEGSGAEQRHSTNNNQSMPQHNAESDEVKGQRKQNNKGCCVRTRKSKTKQRQKHYQEPDQENKKKKGGCLIF